MKQGLAVRLGVKAAFSIEAVLRWEAAHPRICLHWKRIYPAAVSLRAQV